MLKTIVFSIGFYNKLRNKIDRVKISLSALGRMRAKGLFFKLIGECKKQNLGEQSYGSYKTS